MTSAANRHGMKVVVSGILFWFPLAGVTYQFLHYLLALRRLGYDPYYVEDCGRWGVYDPQANTMTDDPRNNIDAVARILKEHGFEDRWAFRRRLSGGDWQGMTKDQVERLYREAEALLNVTGAQDLDEDHLSCPRRIYVESDPFFVQVKAVLGDEEAIRMLGGHDVHFSFGENLGSPDCDVPDAGYRWFPTRQPVALDLWNMPPAADRGCYTTITSWRQNSKDLEYRGETYYWTKHREFERYADVAHRCPVELEAAVNSENEGRRWLLDHGWRVVDGIEISSDMDRYREYVAGSRAELTFARDQYVRPNTGWFSDRSACYLAAGRPVIAQETGFSRFLPTGAGLFSFTSIDEVLAAVDSIESDYEAHRQAARDIGAEYFRAETVVGSLLERAGV